MDLFPQTFRSIDGESDGRSPWIPAVLALALAAWMGWFCLGDISVFEISANARLEVAQAMYEIDAPVEGRVLAMPGLTLGAKVHKGDVLIELDSEVQRLELLVASASATAIARQIETTHREIENEQQALEFRVKQRKSEVHGARSRLREGRVVERLAAEELRRAKQVEGSGVIPEFQQYRLNAELSRLRAAGAALAADVGRIASESSASENDRRARVSALENELARLNGERDVLAAKSLMLTHDIEQRTVRAPADGAVIAIESIHAGSLLSRGGRVATIVASGAMRIVGEFPPAAVFGRIRPGQLARVQFEGFPWTEYGMVTASVSRVASDVIEGRARVELALGGDSDSRIPLQHGLPARVSIEIERSSPARLALRSVGKAISAPTAASDDRIGRLP